MKIELDFCDFLKVDKRLVFDMIDLLNIVLISCGVEWTSVICEKVKDAHPPPLLPPPSPLALAGDIKFLHRQTEDWTVLGRNVVPVCLCVYLLFVDILVPVDLFIQNSDQGLFIFIFLFIYRYHL